MKNTGDKKYQKDCLRGAIVFFVATLLCLSFPILNIILFAASCLCFYCYRQEKKRLNIEENVGQSFCPIFDNNNSTLSDNKIEAAVTLPPQLIDVKFDDIVEWRINGERYSLYVKEDKFGGKERTICMSWTIHSYRIKSVTEKGGEIGVLYITEPFGYYTNQILYKVAILAPIVGLLEYPYNCDKFKKNELILSVDNSPEAYKKQEAARAEIAQEHIETEKKEIAAKIKERRRKQTLYKEVELELIEKGEIFKDAKRPSIPRDVSDTVYRRDGGRCVECGSAENLHFDHIIPFSKGGATNIENLQILCQKCNIQKSNKIG